MRGAAHLRARGHPGHCGHVPESLMLRGSFHSFLNAFGRQRMAHDWPWPRLIMLLS